MASLFLTRTVLDCVSTKPPSTTPKLAVAGLHRGVTIKKRQHESYSMRVYMLMVSSERKERSKTLKQANWRRQRLNLLNVPSNQISTLGRNLTKLCTGVTKRLRLETIMRAY